MAYSWQAGAVGSEPALCRGSRAGALSTSATEAIETWKMESASTRRVNGVRNMMIMMSTLVDIVLRGIQENDLRILIK